MIIMFCLFVCLFINVSVARDSARSTRRNSRRTCLGVNEFRLGPDPPAIYASDWACPAGGAWRRGPTPRNRKRRRLGRLQSFPGRWSAARNRAAARTNCSCSPQCGRWTPAAPCYAPLPSADLRSRRRPATDWRRASASRSLPCSGSGWARRCSRSGGRWNYASGPPVVGRGPPARCR